MSIKLLGYGGGGETVCDSMCVTISILYSLLEISTEKMKAKIFV